MDTDKVIQIPNDNPRIGSCPKCGHAIFKKDAIKEETEHMKAIYLCIECRAMLVLEEVIPF